MFALPAKAGVRTLGIALAILAVAALSPSRAAAECGDHVQIASEKPTDSPLPKPCVGPTCSKRPTPPAAPLSVPPNSIEVSKPFLETVPIAADASVHIKWVVAELLTIPDLNPTSIFHPPRS